MFERLICYVINSILCFLYKKEYEKFVTTKDIKRVQREKLISILRANETSEYGVQHDFKNINSIVEFQKKVPFTIYEDYNSYIEDIKSGKKNVLTSDDVLLLEPTSGSSSASKLIPYTISLKEEFQKGLKPWIYNLYTSCKGIKWGKSYWSVTPATTKNEYTVGGIPIGFEEDSDYLGGFGKHLLSIIFAAPGEIAKEENMENFYYKTALSLLKCKNITFISVWNPTFLLLILDYIKSHSKKLTSALPKKRRFEVQEYIDQDKLDQIWKCLRVISCWCDANASHYAGKLNEVFPNVYIQPKGLLATEGFISIPFINEVGARVSVNSHFFEFISLEDNKVYLTHELKLNAEYQVVITTSGGLYRYKLGDLIKVVGFAGAVPLVRFLGRRDKVSDLFGEKMNELFVESIIKQHGLKVDFYMVAPEVDHYVLYIKTDEIPINIDETFRANFHYDYCRKLGQLKEMKIFKLTGNPEQEYSIECVKRGQRLGDIKPTALHLQGGWDKAFKGEYI